MKRALTSVLAALGASLLFAVACTSTAGVPVRVTLVFEGAAAPVFTTTSGWEIELTRARAITSAIYVYAPRGDTAWRALTPSRAFAHGGLDDGRQVRAELLSPRELDVLDPAPIELGEVDGLAGACEAATIVLDEAAVWIEGVARRGEDEVPFEGALELEDERVRPVTGVRVEGAELDEGARVVFGARPEVWLAEADFAALAIDDDGLARITPGSQPARALYLGVRSAASWTARVEGGS